VGNLNTPLLPIERSSRPPKKTYQQRNFNMNDSIYQMDLADTFHSATVQYTFCLAAHGYFSKIDHLLSRKASLSRYMEIEITTCILFVYNRIKLELNNNKKKKQEKIL
jgi:hypothetical protein